MTVVDETADSDSHRPRFVQQRDALATLALTAKATVETIRTKGCTPLRGVPFLNTNRLTRVRRLLDVPAFEQLFICPAICTPETEPPIPADSDRATCSKGLRARALAELLLAGKQVGGEVVAF